jgi:hypothetical protein
MQWSASSKSRFSCSIAASCSGVSFFFGGMPTPRPAQCARRHQRHWPSNVLTLAWQNPCGGRLTDRDPTPKALLSWTRAPRVWRFRPFF